MVIRTSVSISIKVIFLFFITMNYGLTHSMNKIMKKKNEVVFSFAVFTLENVVYHLFSQKIFLCCITMNYGLTHSMNKIMKKKNEVVFSFAVFTLENVVYHLFSQNISIVHR